MGQHKVGAGELSGLIIILECLVVVLLDVECPGQLITGLRSHGLILGVVEGVQCKLLHLRMGRRM